MFEVLKPKKVVVGNDVVACGGGPCSVGNFGNCCPGTSSSAGEGDTGNK